MALILDGTDGITSSGGTNVLQDDAVITANITDGAVTMPKIGAAGNPGAGNFLRGDGAWETAGSPPGTLELLQEDIFTTSGTFTKATGFDDDDTVMIFLVGGGGGGGVAVLSGSLTHAAAQGGAAGACAVLVSRYADVPSTPYTLTAGAGGSSRNSDAGGGELNGTPGGGSVLSNITEGAFFSAAGGRPLGQAQRSSGSVNLKCFPDDRVGTNVFISGVTGLGLARSNTSKNALFSAGAFQEDQHIPFQIHGVQGARSDADYSASTTNIFQATLLTRQLFGGGGSAAREGQINRASWNQKIEALFNTGGNGSGTANGQNATGIGGGGGASVRHDVATAISGAGHAGGMVVQYYRGRVSYLQVITAVGA